jgi:DNA-binding CsgD family transcriptional regulator/PAS domain-containing protein
MLGAEEHDRLVGRFNASAMGDAPWPETMEQLASAFDSQVSVVRANDSSNRVLDFAAYPFSRQFAAEFFAGDVYGNDPRVKAIAKVRPGTIYFDHALYDVDQINRDPFARACNDAIGIKYSLGAVADLPDGATGVLAILQSETKGHASESAIVAFGRLAPHWAQAMSLGQVLERRASTQDALLEALADKADGVILLNRLGMPTFMNDAARTILVAGDGLAFCAARFITRRGPETRKLQGLIHDAVSASRPSEVRPRGQMLITRPSARRPYVVRVMGAPRTERFQAGGGIACVIHLHDLAAVRLPSQAVLCAIFGLSEREADLAVGMVRCASLTGAAIDCGMALNTARNHLHSIFRKSGTRTQAEAIQLFTRLA